MKVYPVLHKLIYNLEGGRGVPTLELHTSQTAAMKHYRSLQSLATAQPKDGGVTKVGSPMVLATIDIPLNKAGVLLTAHLYNLLAHKGYDAFVELFEVTVATFYGVKDD